METLVLSDASCDALSCVAPQGSVTTPVTSTPEAPSTVAPEVSPAVEKAPTIEVPELPCSEVVKIDGVTIRYGGENINHGGAVLPHKEGLACLDVLTGWLKGVPQSRWQVPLACEEGLGFDPQALAGKRQELLQRFFARKGVELQTEEWQATAEKGAQLTLRPVAN